MSTLRIATFNVYYAQNPKRFSDAIKNNLNLSKADIILLQEVESYPAEGENRAKIIASNLGMECVYTPARDAGIDGTHGLAILSKIKILRHEIVPLPFFNIRHNSRQRIAVNAVLEYQGKILQIANVHLDTRLNIKSRFSQVGAVLEHFRVRTTDKEQPNRIVMAGDFNTLPFVFLWSLIPIFYNNQSAKFYKFLRERGFETKLDQIGYTMRYRFLKFTLDSIFAKGLEIGDFGIERSVSVSDHHPVWVDVIL